MHILLTDILACPRCGWQFGLIVLADSMMDRRIVEGRLGCANCREEYPVRAGVADLRHASVPPAPEAPALDPRPDDERAIRIAALLGVGGAPGPVLLQTRDPGLVADTAELLPNARLVGASGELPPGGVDPDVDWLLHGATLPFQSHSLRGMAILDGEGLPLLHEAQRTLARGARLVIDPAPPGVEELLAEQGLEVLLVQEGVAVASNPVAG